MSTISESPVPHEPHQAGVFPLWCSGCGTDAHLVVESIQAQTPRSSQQLVVFYTCTSCGFSYSHPATVQQAAAILNRRGIQDGLLEFGSHYFHCGEPLSAVKTAPEARLHTKTLRCSCGFELEIPA